MRENHPDRVADMSQEIRDVAERRSKEINRAYDRLKRA
jgi:curved DNA-binding protein CbpA